MISDLENKMDKREYISHIIWGVLLVATFFILSQYNYLLFHSLAEIFSIVIACMVFVLGWNAREQIQNNYLILISVAYLFIGALDLLHTLAYKGMGVFPAYGADLPTQLWMGTRSLETIVLLTAPLLIKRKKISPYVFLACVAVFSALLIFAIFNGYFPQCYIEGVGLTTFKRFAEYFLCLLLATAWFLLYKQRLSFQPVVYKFILTSIAFTILGELSFTFYVSVYGVSNLVGHLAKILSFWCIYKAVVQTGINRPRDILFNELNQSRADLATKAAMLERAESLADLGSWEWDIRNDTWLMSENCEKIYGYFHPQISTSQLLLFAHTEDRPAIEEAFAMALEEGESFDIVHRVIRQNSGEVRYVHAKGVVELDDSGKPAVLLGATQDITERKLTEEKLLNAKQQAESANKSKSEFLANMSHEIRTPLNGIMGMIQLMQETKLNEEQKEYAEMAYMSTKRLNRLLTDILDLSRIEAGKMEVRSEPFDLGEVLDSIGEIFVHAARKNNNAIKIVMDENVPKRLVGDSTRLTEILFNLVGNACKYTNDGQIEVELVKMNDSRKDVNRLLFIVSDNGSGIPDEKISQVFETFTQANDSPDFFSRNYEGAGLGLALVKRLVKLMDGNASIESNPGEGTSVYVSLPFKNCMVDKNLNARQDEIDPKNAQAGKVLLVDDDKISRLQGQKLLQKMGYDVEVAENGMDALNKLPDGFDCVLMDVQMPVMDGVEATKKIRASHAAYKDIPIIAMTAYAMRGDREKFLDAGMDDYLSKPVDKDDLIQILEKHLS